MPKQQATILIIDDKPSVLESLEFFLQHKFTGVITLPNTKQIHSTLEKTNTDVVLLDMNFTSGNTTGNEGLYWLREILKTTDPPEVILMTAYADIELAVHAMKEGATDFVVKPWDNKKLLATIQNAIKLKRSRTRIEQLEKRQLHSQKENQKRFSPMLGISKAFREIMQIVEKVAATDANILLTGENGTGKELIAREIHNRSKRNAEIFVDVDMGSVPESLFESEMFGHVKGAFTDAHENRTGKFEIASGGTIFLDEIGNLSMKSQSKLLKAIEQREITPIGSAKTIHIDVRFISATNQNLIQMIESGSFREDLLFRLNTIQIELPPLRKRKEDIPMIATYYVDYYRKKYEKPIDSITGSAMEKLKEHHWPGNIRELRHAIEKAVILTDKKQLVPADFSFSGWGASGARFENSDTLSVEDNEKKLIERALLDHRWNISKASEQLQITRQTLYRKIKRYGLQ